MIPTIYSECNFAPSKDKTSATICSNCGKEKYLHTLVDNQNKINGNTIQVSICDMLKYSETQWVISCSNCGNEHWFHLPENGDEKQCDCGVLIVVNN